MYKIGEFSTLSKTTIKTLRYYEKEGLLIPKSIDNFTNYRYYETDQLIDLAKIISLRQIGFSIEEIKKILKGNDFKLSLEKRKEKIEEDLTNTKEQLSRINYLLEEKNMKKEVIMKELPDYVVYYKEGTIKSFDELVPFILSSGEECLKSNPDMKCIEPDYCYVSYLDKEYKENDIKISYEQAVEKEGVSNETIKFKKLKPVNAACIYHKGPYSNLRETYSYILNWIKENNYEVIEPIRERYIDGMWNKESEEDWLTELQVPIKKINK